MNPLSFEINEKLNQWLSDPYIRPEHQQELLQLKNNENWNEIENRFVSELEFGTGGLRSILATGPNRLNIYNVRKAAQALARHLNTKWGNPEKKPIVTIAYDNRHCSEEFSQEFACVLAANEIKVYIFDQLTPTPILSYSVRKFQAQAGVMITASHNPQNYNGIKMYNEDGAQVTPPDDELIIHEYNNLKTWNDIQYLDFNQALKLKKVELISCHDFYPHFYQEIVNKSLNSAINKSHGKELKVIFTPLHGTAGKACLEISQLLGFSHFDLLTEQANVDPNFTSLGKITPNPESPAALGKVVEKMLSQNYDLAMASDPDCDRLGLVVNDQGKAIYLNGNQIAFILLDYLIEQRKKLPHFPFEKSLILKSIVTSEMQRLMASPNGIKVEDTLTGFKWMAKRWRQRESEKELHYFFSCEESFGYMPYDFVRDKDAVSSVALMNEAALYYKLQGKNLVTALDDIYLKYGYAEEGLLTFDFEGVIGKKKILTIMNYFRNHPFEFCELIQEQLNYLRDYEVLNEYEFNDQKKKMATSPLEEFPSNVLGFIFKSGHRLFIRPSGTEPKIKFYTMMQFPFGKAHSQENNRDLLAELKKDSQNKMKFIEQNLTQIVKKLTE
jgi:phosphoglucomutase